MQVELIVFISTTLLVIIGCLLPAGWLPPLPNDKVLHFSAFAALSLLATRIVKSEAELSVWFLVLFLVGLSIEIAQTLVPGRSFCWKDLAANTAGIFTAFVYVHNPL
ncbi:VanZ family protein [Noviherbaspirillum sp.]|jgi:VanZ family protein|uniref:VanZ family protein n=1 Tax=Noviherbaspirillum sp. TaxID=1926288 RepID=UPI0039C950FC